MGTGGFSLWDRAKNNREKSMAFVYNATHNGFITDNRDYKTTGVELVGIQRNITKAYVNAFFRTHLKWENIWNPIFQGEYIPSSVPKKDIYLQYRNMENSQQVVIEEFDGLTSLPSNISASTGFDLKITQFDLRALTYSGTMILTENTSERLDKYSPHFFEGLHVSYPAAGGEIEVNIPSSKANVSAFSFFSFRICHVTNLSLVDYPDLSKMKIRLVDGAIPPKFDEYLINKKIPVPSKRIDYTDPSTGWQDSKSLTKSALITIRIPLSSFSIDLTNVKKLVFIFPVTVSGGKVDIDDIEFTN